MLPFSPFELAKQKQSFQKKKKKSCLVPFVLRSLNPKAGQMKSKYITSCSIYKMNMHCKGHHPFVCRKMHCLNYVFKRNKWKYLRIHVKQRGKKNLGIALIKHIILSIYKVSVRASTTT